MQYDALSWSNRHRPVKRVLMPILGLDSSRERALKALSWEIQSANETGVHSAFCGAIGRWHTSKRWTDPGNEFWDLMVDA